MNARTRSTPVRNLRRGLTLVELLIFVALAVFVVVGATVLPALSDGRMGRLLGGTLGLLAFFVVALLWGAVLAFAVEGVPKLPQCGDGDCRGEDYRLHESKSGFHWVCRHGGHYARRGRKFVRVAEDGSETPYLVWRPFRGWFPDRPPEANRAGEVT